MGMSSKQKQIPAIRFEGFTDAWEQRKLGELASFSKGAGYTKGDLTAAGKPIILYGRLYTKYETVIENVDTFVDEKEKSVISAGNEVIVPASGETSEDISRASVVAKAGIILGGDLNIVKPNTEIDPAFLALTISNGRQQKELSKKAQGKSVVHLHNSDLKEVDLVYPQKEEQSKIGIFFKHLDDTIALHQRQLDNCKQLKSSMMQKIFNQELRFKDENGKDYPEWQKYDLSEIVDRVTRKNTGLISELPLTISAQYGLVDQLTFFNKTIAGVNLEAYYLLKNGEFAYNKSYSSGYPLGAIKRLDKYDAGLLSTLYICFSPRNNVDSDFLTQYFESTKWHKQIVNISGEGARNHGLLNIAVGDFFSTEHILPCKEEQQRIANLLYSLDKMIDLSKRKVESLNEQKKGLVRLMFV